MHERLGWRAFAIWSAVFCVHRLAVLWWGFDGVFYWEETYRLLAAEALWRGWPWPLLDLQADPYAGGSLVVSALAVPVVATVGASIVGLKLIALAWSTLGLLCWTWLVDRWWGARAAHVFAGLFVFAPPLFVIYNLIAMGSHAEVATLGGLQLVLAYRLLYGGDRSPWLAATWAAVAGLGTWFTYDAVVFFVICVAIGVAGGMLPARRWPTVAAGFVVGFTPWIFTNVASGGRGVDVVIRTFGLGTADHGRAFSDVLEHLQYLVQTGIPLGLRYPEVVATLTGGAPRRLLLAHVYLALYAASAAALLWSRVRSRRAIAADASRRRWLATSPELPLLLLFVVFVAMLLASDQVFLEHERVPFLSFRLMVPFLPPVMAVIAVAAAKASAIVRRPELVVLALIGVAGTVQLLQSGAASRPRRTAEARMLGAEAAGHLLYYKHGADVPVLAERIAVMPAELQPPAWNGVGYSIAYHFPDDRPVAELARLVDATPSAYRGDVVHGMREALGPGLEQVNPRPASAHTRKILDAVDSLGRSRAGQ